MDYKKLKGNLGLKSSALAPTACKLSSQFLVLDHMSNHYMKIARAKSAIDSRPPKSLAASQKMRDRMSRDQSARSPLPRSHSSMSGVNMYEYEDILKDEPEDEEEKLVHSIMRSTLLDKARSSNNATYGSLSHANSYEKDTRMSQQMAHDTHYSMPYGTMTYDQPSSVRSVKSGHSLTSSASRQAILTSMMPSRTSKGDVLEKRPHLFTEPEQPFTPRTLKKNTESRLKHSKCYNPPRIKNGVHTQISDEKGIANTQNNNDRGTTNTQNNNQKGTTNTQNNNEKGITNTQNNNEKGTTKSQRQHRQSPPKTNQHKKVKDSSNNDLQQTSQLSDSMLMDITVHSRGEIYGENVNHNVPPLAITMDQDHMNWLQEQASKAEIRVRSSGRLKSSLHPDQELHPRNKYHSYRESGLGADANKEKQRKDEEQKYLAFAKEVTDDVLSRGISTDRIVWLKVKFVSGNPAMGKKKMNSVLYRVFENHIERRKSDLDEGRMRKVISDLRKNLGLKDSLAKGETFASLSDSNYNNKLGKENATVRRSSNSHQQNASIKSATDREEHLSLYQTNVHSEMSSSMESDSTLKFGQTGDILSTINSETNLELRERETKLDSGSELTETQTWKQYELSLTAKEERGESSSSAIDDEHAVSKRENDNVTHSPGQERRSVEERRLAENEKFKSNISHVREHKVRSAVGSRRTSSIETNTDGEIIFSGNSHPNSEYENHKQTSEEISSSDKYVSLSQESNPNSHRDQDSEDVSVKSHTSFQRPTAKPRTRVRQGSYEMSQDKSNDLAPVAADKVQENEAQMTSEIKHNHIDVSTKEETNVGPALVELDNNSREEASTVDKSWNDHHNHQDPSEENDDYEDDYEEVIDSEEDSADDF